MPRGRAEGAHVQRDTPEAVVGEAASSGATPEERITRVFDDDERTHSVGGPGEGNETPQKKIEPVDPLAGGLAEMGKAIWVALAAERIAQNPRRQCQEDKAHFGRE